MKTIENSILDDCSTALTNMRRGKKNVLNLGHILEQEMILIENVIIKPGSDEKKMK